MILEIRETVPLTVAIVMMTARVAAENKRRVSNKDEADTRRMPDPPPAGTGRRGRIHPNHTTDRRIVVIKVVTSITQSDGRRANTPILLQQRQDDDEDNPAMVLVKEDCRPKHRQHRCHQVDDVDRPRDRTVGKVVTKCQDDIIVIVVVVRYRMILTTRPIL